MHRPLILAQRTPFCRKARDLALRGSKGEVLCESFSAFEEGKARVRDHTGPALLIWGDGRCHQFSNILNRKGMVKYVFDRHMDNAEGGRGPEFDSHNSYSREEGVILRVCYSIGRAPQYYEYDPRGGNGLHISVDLDVVRGFPALPWMCTGDTELEKIERRIGRLIRDHGLLRFDIGGFCETGSPDGRAMEEAYSTYYARLIGMALDTFSLQIRNASREGPCLTLSP